MRPVRCSATYRKHLALGATMADYHGWRVATQFASADEEARRVRETVGLADVSWLGKLDLKGHDVSGGTAHALPLPGQGTIWQLARGHALVTCEPAALARWHVGTLARWHVPGGCVHVTDVTSVYAALLLAGPQSRDILPKLTELDVSPTAMPNPSCAQAGLARVHAIVRREDVGDGPAGRVLAYWLLVGREYGEYVWDTIIDAGREFGIVPFGLTALRRMKSEE